MYRRGLESSMGAGSVEEVASGKKRICQDLDKAQPDVRAWAELAFILSRQK
jgi:hypothetical protein